MSSFVAKSGLTRALKAPRAAACASMTMATMMIITPFQGTGRTRAT